MALRRPPTRIELKADDAITDYAVVRTIVSLGERYSITISLIHSFLQYKAEEAAKAKSKDEKDTDGQATVRFQLDRVADKKADMAERIGINKRRR